MPEPVRLLSEKMTAEMINCSRRSLERWRVDGTGPEFCRVGKRRIAYPEAGVILWIAARTFTSHAAELASAIDRPS